MKAERIDEGRHITDTLNGTNFVEGQNYIVTFPDGTSKKLPAIVLRQVVVQSGAPYLVMREQAFFAVSHCGLNEVWCRAIDLPDIIDATSDPVPVEPVKTPRKRKH